MKANEFRIGNLFYDYNGNVVVMSEKIFSDMATGGWADSQYILLTEKWLTDFGIEKMVEPNIYDIDGHYSEFIDGCIIYYGDRKIKYVHQLQNLYFALSGKELTKV